MKTRAAVVYEPGKPIEIEELELNGPPGDGEVLIEVRRAGHQSPRAAAVHVERTRPVHRGSEAARHLLGIYAGAAHRGDHRARGRHNRAWANSCNRTPVIGLIHVVIRHKPNFFNRVTGSLVVSNNR